MFYIYKRKYCNVAKYNDDKLYEDNIKGDLSLNYIGDDYEDKLYNIFSMIVWRLSTLYNSKKNDLGLISYSNFFKTDSTYREVILREIDEILKEDFLSKSIDEYMSVFE